MNRAFICSSFDEVISMLLDRGEVIIKVPLL